MATKGTQNRLSAESSKSAVKNSDEAINALYDVISNYNGVIRRIIEVIEPVKGKWSTRKSINQSTVGYFASVLKGLIEPLKHLMFQLANVNDPTVASMTDLFVNMIDIIDDSPPFKLIDIQAYKNGKPNVEGLSDDMKVDSLKAYIEACDEKIEQLKQSAVDPEKHIRSALSNVAPHLREKVRAVGMQKYRDAKELMKFWDQEKKKAREKFLANPDGKVKFPGNLNNKTDTLIDELTYNTWMDPLDVEELTELMEKELTTGKAAHKQSSAEAIRLLEKTKSRYENAYKDYMDKATGVLDITQIPLADDAEDYQNVVQEIEKIKRGQKSKTENKKEPFESTNNANTSVDASLGELPKVSEPAPVQPPANAGETKTGLGFIKSDFNKQQYNSMGRPLSNDDKINNDMINANNNWQISSNTPHDVPVGNLNPFLPKPQNEKYSYVDELRKANSQLHPEKNALGADISLLQGPITNISGSGSNKKKPKALEKIEAIAVDEKNDMFKKTPMGENGMIQEEKEDQFKFPELRPKKEKSGRRR